MITEKASYPKFYQNIELDVFAPRFYYQKHVKSDNYSYHIWLSKEKDLSLFFWLEIKTLVDELKNSRVIMCPQLVTIIPRSNGTYSPTMEAIAKKLAEYLNCKYETIIKTVKTSTKKSGTNVTHEQRYKMISGSISIKRTIYEKEIVVLDDTRTTGMSFLECKKVFSENGNPQIVAICLGINSSVDREKERYNL